MKNKKEFEFKMSSVTEEEKRLDLFNLSEKASILISGRRGPMLDSAWRSDDLQS